MTSPERPALSIDPSSAACAIAPAAAADAAAILRQVMLGRRTVGSFRPELPPRETIVSAIEAATWAPNHRKTEPWRFHLLGPQTVRQTIELNCELVGRAKGAAAAESKRKSWSAVPGWLAISCALAGDALTREEDYAACCCAAQNLALALWAEGIGTKWSTGEVIRDSRFLQLLGLSPETSRVVGLFWYGYPAVTPQQNRRPVTEVLCDCP